MGDTRGVAMGRWVHGWGSHEGVHGGWMVGGILVLTMGGGSPWEVHGWGVLLGRVPHLTPSHRGHGGTSDSAGCR